MHFSLPVTLLLVVGASLSTAAPISGLIGRIPIVPDRVEKLRGHITTSNPLLAPNDGILGRRSDTADELSPEMFLEHAMKALNGILDPISTIFKAYDTLKDKTQSIQDRQNSGHELSAAERKQLADLTDPDRGLPGLKMSLKRNAKALLDFESELADLAKNLEPGSVLDRVTKLLEKSRQVRDSTNHPEFYEPDGL